MNYTQWTLLLQHPNLNNVTLVYSSVYKPLVPYISINDTGVGVSAWILFQWGRMHDASSRFMSIQFLIPLSLVANIGTLKSLCPLKFVSVHIHDSETDEGLVQGNVYKKKTWCFTPDSGRAWFICSESGLEFVERFRKSARSKKIFEGTGESQIWLILSMATGGRSLEQTLTWAVAWLKKRHRRALYETLEKVKPELMPLGFMSLLPTVGQRLISTVCISKNVGAAWHPCIKFERPRRANCSEAQPEGDCYQPDNVVNHASYAFDSYYQKKGRPFSSTFPGVKA